VSLAQSTSAALSPYVAVHWRMETISKEDRLLLDCARSLITQLDKQINHTGTLFLLTDYPHIFTRAQQDLAISDKATDEELRSWVIPYSDTFHYDNIGPVHHQAIQYLYEHRNVTLFGKNYPYSPPQWRIINAPETDHGFLGILDKLMAVNADAFLAGRPHVCARASTFTAQIQLERKNKLDESSHYFGYDI
jgi:hypothetical protein